MIWPIKLPQELIYLLNQNDLELFLVQAWPLWNRRNHFIKGEKLQEPCILNTRASKFLKEFQSQQIQDLRIPDPRPVDLWQAPPTLIYKLNFDGAIFSNNQSSGFGAIILNDR